MFQADQFSRAVQEGIFYPRWLLDSNNGYGSPNFIFYSPLSYYFVAAINLLISSLVTSMIIAIWFSFFLSGLTMFIASRKIFGRSGSLLAAIIYQILPFHLLDLYARGTFAELFAFLWFPFIILFMHDLFEKSTKTALIGLSMSYAALILTHLVSGFIFTFVIGSYLVYNAFFLKDKKPFIKTSLSLSLGLGLSSFFLVPAILERKFVHIEYLITCPACDYKKNFLFIWGKVQSVLQHFYIQLNIGVALEIMLFIVLILLVLSNQQRLKRWNTSNFFIYTFLFALFLATPLSKPVWNFIPFFPILQFPWRWVPVMELSLCLLIGDIFSYEDRPSLKSTDIKKRMVIYLILPISLFSCFIIFKTQIVPQDIMIRKLDPQEIKLHMDPTIEYIPIWVSNIGILSEQKNDKLSVMSGMAQYDVIEWRSEKRVFHIKASRFSVLKISTFYYPGWIASLDGRDISIAVEKQTAAMLVNIPEGDHILKLIFKDTPLRYYGRIISLLSLLLLVVIFMSDILKRKSKCEPSLE